MDHHRPMLGVVGAGVAELEALRHLEVELAGAALPGAAQRVGDVEVDLRPVEGALPGALVVVAALPRERLPERVLGTLPLLVRTDRLLRSRRELHPHVVEAETLIEL